jgi:hypothetical protein
MINEKFVRLRPWCSRVNGNSHTWGLPNGWREPPGFSHSAVRTFDILWAAVVHARCHPALRFLMVEKMRPAYISRHSIIFSEAREALLRSACPAASRETTPEQTRTSAYLRRIKQSFAALARLRHHRTARMPRRNGGREDLLGLRISRFP